MKHWGEQVIVLLQTFVTSSRRAGIPRWMKGFTVGSSLTKRCFNLAKSFSSIGTDDGPATEPRAFNAAFDRLNRTTWHNLCAACGVLLYRARGNGYVAASIAGFDFIGITGSGPIMMERYLLRWISTIYAFQRRERERMRKWYIGNGIMQIDSLVAVYDLFILKSDRVLEWLLKFFELTRGNNTEEDYLALFATRMKNLCVTTLSSLKTYFED